MSATIENHGTIEIICQNRDVTANRAARLIFRAHDEVTPPFRIRVKSPAGNVIVERVIRALPTGEPQSPEPITFTVQRGAYDIEILQLRGSAEGKAILTVS
jgi:hypothetical protein